MPRAMPRARAAPLERAAAGFASSARVWEVALTELSLGEALVALGRGERRAVLDRAAEEFARLASARARASAATARTRAAVGMTDRGCSRSRWRRRAPASPRAASRSVAALFDGEGDFAWTRSQPAGAGE